MPPVFRHRVRPGDCSKQSRPGSCPHGDLSLTGSSETAHLLRCVHVFQRSKHSLLGRVDDKEGESKSFLFELKENTSMWF